METALEIVGPFLAMAKDKDKISDEEKIRRFDKMCDMKEEIIRKLSEHDEEFKKIKESNIEIEKKLEKLYKIIDEEEKYIYKEDIHVIEASCQLLYFDYWEKLDDISKKYLIMANYLYTLFKKDNIFDFSPSILEFGRSFENELIIKIYNGYIEWLGEKKKLKDPEQEYSLIKKAVNNANKYGEYYIPARKMIKYLTHVSDENFKNDYNEELKKYLDFNDIDKYIVSEKMFTDEADIIIAEYRNKSAHAGTVMSDEDVKNCLEKSKYVLSNFMKAID